MNLTKKAEKEIQKALNSPKVQTKTLEIIQGLVDQKFTHADIMALGMLLLRTSNNVLEERANDGKRTTLS